MFNKACINHTFLGKLHTRFIVLTRWIKLKRCFGEIESHERDLAPADRLTLTHQRQETALQTIYTRYYTDLVTAMTANLVADVVTYPLETLVIRLCVQGTRTLVDNMDTGDVVVPIVSSYDGFTDALRGALDSPLGVLGLYRGFGALAGQYAIQAAFLYGIPSRTYTKLPCFSFFNHACSPVTIWRKPSRPITIVSYFLPSFSNMSVAVQFPALYRTRWFL
ncbi:unnamed protein product [Echinostoma caproni]|uniref:ADP/ATP translocase n=1 Tax=Echinostoma caproni TaxID=27848 RepID=A0A183AU18_9TREM|nr:unnamed protein product [Echinostoma caproni]